MSMTEGEPYGLDTDERVEKLEALPNSAAKTIALGATCHHLILTLPTGAECKFSLAGVATATDPVLDASMMMRLAIPGGASTLYVFTESDMSAFKLSIQGW